MEYGHVSFYKVQEHRHLGFVLVCLNLYKELGDSLQRIWRLIAVK